MNKTLVLKRPLIWLKRFRNRRGYGIHSPFAFDFIANVIYEKTHYYDYAIIEESNAYRKIRSRAREICDSKKINRLLFRMVNRFQPGTIVEFGSPLASSLYLQAAKREVSYKAFTSLSEFETDTISRIDFLYIHYDKDADILRRAIKKALLHIHARSVVIVGGIHYSSSMKRVWNELKENKLAIITFDLYDLGIVFFDHNKNKQHYTINF